MKRPDRAKASRPGLTRTAMLSNRVPRNTFSPPICGGSLQAIAKLEGTGTEGKLLNTATEPLD
jgi:hypothetical protein